MSAPLAEVPPPMPHRASRKAPPLLSAFVIFGLILGVCSIIFYTPQIPEISPNWERALIAIAIIIFYNIPLLLLWRGLNWARWLMIGLSVLGIVFWFANPWLSSNSEMTPTSPAEDFLVALSLPYDLALIVFLLTPAMRRHFTGRPNEAAQL